jgi:hypothetical protein
MKWNLRFFIMRFLCSSTLLFLSLLSASSYALDKPKNRVILTISGAINTTNVGQEAQFDLEMLQALPQHTITTHNPWTEGAHTYQGFSLKDLLDSLGNQGTLLQISALNQYMTEAPLQDYNVEGAILATHQDGKPMSVRKLGPIMVIYPFDTNNDFKTEVYYGRSVWQVNKINSLIITE